MLKDYEKIRNLDYKKDFSLKQIKQILNLLDNPEKKIEIIHIAGTKGKTSTAFYLSQLLQMNGYKNIGLYTSPHILSPNERIQVNGQPIKEDKLNQLFDSVEKTAQDNKITLTYFEVMTAAAFLYFKEMECSFVVLETGLGGRLDATNAVTPLVSIITRIDKDHTNILGNNQLKIAWEKYGIIKKNRYFILSKQSFWVNLLGTLIGSWRNSKRIPLLDYTIKKINHQYSIFTKKVEVLFDGPFYGIENFINALTFLSFIKPNFSGCFHFVHQVPGRFEIYENGKGKIILDGAHNPVSAKQLALSLKEICPDQKWKFVFNTFPDKDYKGMIDEFYSVADEFIVIEKENFAAFLIIEYLKERKISYQILSQRDLRFKVDEFYCVTGSFYLIGDLKSIILKRININENSIE